MHANAIAQCFARLSTADFRRELLGAATGRRSYGEVRDGMMGYAGWLSGAEGIRPGERVAICLPKTLETLQLVYGILAAGAAYVPLPFDGAVPRLSQILASLRPALFVTTKKMAAMLRLAGVPLPAGRMVEVEDDEALAKLSQGIPPRKSIAEVSPRDLAAVFFTSGSTGEPKGVMWSQRGMAAAIAGVVHRRKETAADRLINIAALHYTGAANIFSTVLSGGRVYLCDDREMLIAEHIAAILEREGTTIWLSSATALRMLVEAGNLPTRDLRALRHVQIVGERMPIATLRAAMAAMPNAEFHNLYAASEAFDMAVYPIPRPLDPDLSVLPLGWPCAGYELSLRDEAGREVAAGEIGEICVVGSAVTIGYWDDPALSAARRLSGVADSYRTGDLARRDSDGLLTLVGRQDHVVKLRGHRFDLGEIEAVAKAAPGVREAVAFVINGPTEASDIVLAILSDAIGEARTGLEHDLQQIAQDRLPRFARPRRLIILGEFPRLSSGKTDRQGLERLVAPA